MISSLVALTSLNLALTLIQAYGVVAKTWAITNATTTTPITVTSPAHGVPLGRVVHGIVTGVTGTLEANGLWILTPVDADTFSLSTLTAQGNRVQSSSSSPYTGGGQIQTPYAEWSILLGRRNVALASAAATPRFVFVPTDGRAWGFEPYGGAGPSIVPAVYPNVQGSPEQQTMSLQPQIATQFPTFEVHVFGCTPDIFRGAPPMPDSLDFDVTQYLVHALFGVFFDETGGLPRAKVLRENWPSQKEGAGSMTQRGQHWMGILELQQPVVKRPPGQFAPPGVSGAITVEPVNPASGDPVVIVINS
jgi:hypothetical protein